jgi:hypothetical protein
VSDLAFVVPLGKWTNKGIGMLGKAATRGAVKAMPNKMAQFFTKRAAEGLKVAKFGSKLRNKIVFEKLKGMTTNALERSIIEGTEEGAQNLIVKKYLNGEYDDDYANPSFIDALTDGTLPSDIWDNIKLRATGFSVAMGWNKEYSNDQ